LPIAPVRFQAGSKFKAVNGLDRNSAPAKIEKRKTPIGESIQHSATVPRLGI
jgi:hypothetical protein